jgi:hypothetical protein
VALLLVTVWGGETYAWTSVQIYGLAALSAAAPEFEQKALALAFVTQGTPAAAKAVAAE